MNKMFLLILTASLISFEAHAKPWVGSGNKSMGTGDMTGTAEDERTLIVFGCNASLGPSVSGSIDGYRGTGLKKVDDGVEPVTFEIAEASGKTNTVKAQINYFAPDAAWAFQNLPLSLVDSLASGKQLLLRNEKGGVVARFDLEGAVNARAALKKYCGF